MSIGTPMSKVERRCELLHRRRSVTAEVRVAAGVVLREVVLHLLEGGPGPVAAYVSTASEPDTGPLLAALQDVEVLLPVLLEDGDLDWARSDGRLAPGRRGLREPVGARLGPAAIGLCGLVVVPALAVDRAGVRLGRGGGSYDRALARTTGYVLAPLFDEELVDALPAEPHDQPVDAVVLPREGLVRVGRLHRR